MMPALAIGAVYSLLLAWNDYLYQMVLLSAVRNVTLSMTQAPLFGDADPPWNAMMASAILYVFAAGCTVFWAAPAHRRDPHYRA